MDASPPATSAPQDGEDCRRDLPRPRQPRQDEDEEEEEDDDDRPVLSLFQGRCGGSPSPVLGAAAYRPCAASLRVLPDAGDLPPDFAVARALLAQENPALVLLSVRQVCAQ